MTGSDETRAVIFGDARYIKSITLTKAALKLAHQLDGFRVVAICDARRAASQPRLVEIWAAMAQPFLEKLFDPKAPLVVHRDIAHDLHSVARRYNVEVITPPGRNINDPGFIRNLQDRYNPSLALSFGCPQVFGRNLLGVFKTALNNHSGLLPDYRGTSATQWSIYAGEKMTGFTYHLMTTDVDAGPVLCMDKIPIGARSLKQLQIEKFERSAMLLESVLCALLAGDAGRSQAGKGRFFHRDQTREITTIEQPSALTWPELQRRLRAFGWVWLRINGEFWKVTKFKRPASAKNLEDPRCFMTSDGVPVAATRFAWLPFSLARLFPRHLLNYRRSPGEA
jgi:methionyl-tRNA formyltransferase